MNHDPRLTAIDFAAIPSPCYVLEERLLRQNLTLIKNVMDEAGCEIILALKGFSMFSAFPIVKEYLNGATASSLNEVKLINDYLGCQAHTYSPAYLDSEFDEIMARSSHITFNTLSQWERFKNRIIEPQHFVANSAMESQNVATLHKISCGIRINPQYSEVETDMYNPCVAGSRLGITRDKLGDTLPEGIEGLHFHTLCENGSDTLERTLEAVEARFGDLLYQAKWLNMGGGHLMTREGYDIKKLISLVKNIQTKYNIDVILEPGSAIAWRTGYLTSTVLDIMDSQGVEVAVLDMSFAAHLPDTLEMPYKPHILGAYHEPILDKPTYRLGGMTCLAGDFIGDYSFDEPLKIGDSLVFDDMIHYTMVKTTTFNGVNLPSIGVIQTDGAFKLIREYGYESFKDRLS
jgi:carboxynorspermidine decarboxylase